MRRVIAIAVAGVALAGCSSFSFDAFKSTPPTVQVQLESMPPGADAVTSLGPACKTPCSVAVAAPDSGFSVTYTLNKFQPVTIPVQVIRIPGDFSTPGSTDSRSQSGGCGASAGGAAAQGRPEEGVETEKASTAAERARRRRDRPSRPAAPGHRR